MTMIVSRHPLCLTCGALDGEHTDTCQAMETFVTLFALRILQVAKSDLLSSRPERRIDAMSFLHSQRAEDLASGIGLDIDWARSEMDSDHFFVELPDLQHGGKRFRSAMQPVVIRGVIRPCADGDVYRILVQEPVVFLERHEVVTSADWIEVAGPARWLSEDEYIALLKASKVDRSYVAAARRAAGARR